MEFIEELERIKTMLEEEGVWKMEVAIWDMNRLIDHMKDNYIEDERITNEE